MAKALSQWLVKEALLVFTAAALLASDLLPSLGLASIDLVNAEVRCKRIQQTMAAAGAALRRRIFRYGCTKDARRQLRVAMAQPTLDSSLRSAGGLPYQGIKDLVREEMATLWLADASVTFAEIAERLGFGDVSSFYKAPRK
jgi:AraC-like DNA-binding protein